MKSFSGFDMSHCFVICDTRHQRYKHVVQITREIDAELTDDRIILVTEKMMSLLLDYPTHLSPDVPVRISPYILALSSC